MSVPPGEYPDREAAELAGRIDAEAQAAYRRFLQFIDEGKSPQEAIREVMAGFEGACYAALAAAFTAALAEPWTPKAMRSYPVSDVTLSARLYEHRRQSQAEVTAIVREHAKGLHQARELALRLYEGYGFRADEPLKVAAGNFRTLPKALRSLATEPAVRATLMQSARRSASIQLRTRALRSAYMQTFDAALAGASRPRLERLLKVAVYEKSRYFANRIAQTELGQAYSKRRAAEIMADDTIEVVQWRLSGAHPVEDICDLLAKVDRFGLGPGCYPKRLAPRPLAHPFCMCRLRTRPDLRAADARLQEGAEREFLAALPEREAARVMGSQARLKRVLGGQDAREAWNRGRDAGYRVMLLGKHSIDRPGSVDRQWLPATDAYEAAKAGGRHSGWYQEQLANGVRQIVKGIRSIERQLTDHEQWLANPDAKVDDWLVRDERYRAGLLRRWQRDVQRHREQIEILNGILAERRRRT